MGDATSDTTDLPPLEISGDGPAYCGRCGYDLRGLTLHRCPECGADLRRVGAGQSRPKRANVLLRCFLFLLIYLPTAVLLAAAAVPLLPTRTTIDVDLFAIRRQNESAEMVHARVEIQTLEWPFFLPSRTSGEGSAQALPDVPLVGEDSGLFFKMTFTTLLEEAAHFDLDVEGAALSGIDEVMAASAKTSLDEMLSAELAEAVQAVADGNEPKKTFPILYGPNAPSKWYATHERGPVRQDSPSVTHPMVTLPLIGFGLLVLLLLASRIDLRPKRWRQRAGHYD